MARRLRLHFASRRSSTDPLSESFSSHGETSGAAVPARSPTETLAHGSSHHLKGIALSADYAALPQLSSVFIPGVNAGGCTKKSVLQISLQPRGKVGAELEASTEDGDPGGSEPGLVGGSDGGSCSSSMASDAGYCSSNSIFESEGPERLRTSQDRSLLRRKSRLPLRRCSSLVIFPKSPCSTPPASPVSPVAFPFLPPPSRGSHQSGLQAPANEFPDAEDVAWKGSTSAESGDCRRKESSSAEPRDTRHMVQFNIPLEDEPKGKMEDADQNLDRSNRHSSSLLLRFGHQRPAVPRKGAAATAEGYSEARNSAAYPESKQDPHKKLYRSTSACLFSSAKSSEKSPSSCSVGTGRDMPEENCHRAIQRSFSLEVPYANTGISCHVSNPNLSSPCSPHVHIHLTPCCPAKAPGSAPSVNTSHKWSGAEAGPGVPSKVSDPVLFCCHLRRKLKQNKDGGW